MRSLRTFQNFTEEEINLIEYLKVRGKLLPGQPKVTVSYSSEDGTLCNLTFGIHKHGHIDIGDDPRFRILAGNSRFTELNISISEEQPLTHELCDYIAMRVRFPQVAPRIKYENRLDSRETRRTLRSSP